MLCNCVVLFVHWHVVGLFFCFVFVFMQLVADKGDTPVAQLYGPEHLLRMFGELPVLASRREYALTHSL